MIFNSFKNLWLLFLSVLAGLSYAQNSQACSGEGATFLPCFQQSCNRYKNYLHMEKGIHAFEDPYELGDETSNVKKRRLDSSQEYEAKEREVKEGESRFAIPSQVAVLNSNAAVSAIVQLPQALQFTIANYLSQIDIFKFARTCDAVHQGVRLRSQHLPIRELLKRREVFKPIDVDQFIQAFPRLASHQNQPQPQPQLQLQSQSPAEGVVSDKNITSLYYNGFRILFKKPEDILRLIEHPAFLNHIFSLTTAIPLGNIYSYEYLRLDYNPHVLRDPIHLTLETWNQFGTALGKSKIRNFSLVASGQIPDKGITSFFEGFPDEAHSRPSSLMSISLNDPRRFFDPKSDGLNDPRRFFDSKSDSDSESDKDLKDEEGKESQCEWVQVLSRKLKAMPHLTSLDLSGNGIRDMSSVRALADGLSHLSNLTSVNLNKNQMTKEGILHILNALRRNCPKLFPKGAQENENIDPDVARLVIKNLGHFVPRIPQPIEFGQSDCWIGGDSVAFPHDKEVCVELFKGISAYLRGVHTLHINDIVFSNSGVGITPDVVAIFVRMAPLLKNLNKVILTQGDYRPGTNFMQDIAPSMQPVFTYLSTHHQITDLTLDDVFAWGKFEMTSDEVKLFFSLLSQFKQLKKLKFCEWKDRGWIEGFPILHELTELDFRTDMASVSTDGTRQFFNTLGAYPKLETLSMRNSSLRDEDLPLLFKALRNGFLHLKRLNLGNQERLYTYLNRFSVDGLSRFKRAVESDFPGLTVSFDGNERPQEGTTATSHLGSI